MVLFCVKRLPVVLQSDETFSISRDSYSHYKLKHCVLAVGQVDRLVGLPVGCFMSRLFVVTLGVLLLELHWLS